MKRRQALASMVSTAVLATLGAVLTPVPAQAADDSPGCVTGTEFDLVRAGMRKFRVHELFGTQGNFAGGTAGGFKRVYRTCNATWAVVEFTSPSAGYAFASGYKRWKTDTPGCVTYREWTWVNPRLGGTAGSRARVQAVFDTEGRRVSYGSNGDGLTILVKRYKRCSHPGFRRVEYHRNNKTDSNVFRSYWG